MSDNLDNDLPPEMPESEGSPDFDNFDPAQYVAKHRQGLGRSRSSDQESENEAARLDRGLNRGRGARDIPARSGRRSVRQEESIADAERPVGFFAKILGAARSGEGLHLYVEIISEALPLIGRFLPIVGCGLVLACACVCGGGYLLIRLVSR